MLALDEPTNQITNMGYIETIPLKPIIPSFYKLEDGTIISVLCKLTHILKASTGTKHMNLIINDEVHVFVPPEKRIVPNKMSKNPDNIISKDVTHVPIKEEFNVYDINADFTINVKTLVSQVVKTNQTNLRGEPIYKVNLHPLIQIKQKE